MSGDSQSPVAISSPMSACSPGPPTLAPRAVSVMSHDTPSPAGVVTHKEWIVPPRPKPGRKPATDTPPTKRKAQNRAAQRAFRERRAARVNELEDKLKEVELETSTQITEYQEQVNQLAMKNAELAKENSLYKTKVECLRGELELLRQVKADEHQQQKQHSSAPVASFSSVQVASPAPSSHENPCSSNCACTDDLDRILCDKKSPPSDILGSAPLPAPSVPIRRRSNRNKAASEFPQNPDPLGCGRCSREGNCACITEAVEAAYPVKRPTSPSENTPKRTRISSNVGLTPPDELETDFTYMTKPPPAPPSFSGSPVISHMPADPCGFCSDGTHCVCAEAAANAMMNMDDDEEDSEEHHSTKLPPLLSNLTPPRGDQSLEGHNAEKPMPLYPPMTKSTGSGCPPGGCAQCKNDPMSTLFCQSVATKVKARSAGAPAGCCGGGCCGDKQSPKDTTGEKGTFIPASAAYQALSRHRGFEEATADLGSLLRPLMVRSGDGRCPQVEVSSVRDVLKQLDRRFGSDAA